MKHFTLMPNPYRDRGFQISQKVQSVLEASGAEVKICLPFHVDQGYELPQNIRFSTMEDALKECEALICLGGDGTILHAARMVGNRNIPLLGINTGTMGFLAELESTELSLLPSLIQDRYTLDTRMMLHVTVRRNGRTISDDYALNDAVITKGAVARVISLSVLCDGQQAMEYDADGIILATPTGTTAYSVSAGGPIVEPAAENIIVSPICPHILAIRSLVLSKTRTVTVRIGRIGRRNAFLSVDGGRAFRLNADDEVVATAADRSVKLLKLKNTGFYEILNQKFQG